MIENLKMKKLKTWLINKQEKKDGRMILKSKKIQMNNMRIIVMRFTKMWMMKSPMEMKKKRKVLKMMSKAKMRKKKFWFNHKRRALSETQHS